MRLPINRYRLEKNITIRAADDGNSTKPVHVGAPKAYQIDGSPSVTIEGLEVESTLDAANENVINTANNASIALTVDNATFDVSASGGFSDNARIIHFGGQLNATNSDFSTDDASIEVSAIVGRGTNDDTNVGVTSGGSAAGNTFSALDVGVQIPDSKNLQVSNNSFDNITDESVLIADADDKDDSNPNTRDVTVNGNDFGETSQVGSGVIFNATQDDNGDFGDPLVVRNNNFYDVSGKALATTVSFSVSGILTDGDDGSIDASENYWGDSNGPTDQVSDASGRGSGEPVADGRNATIAFVPFLGSANGSPTFPDNTLFVNNSSGGTGVVGSSTSKFAEFGDGTSGPGTTDDNDNDALAQVLPGETIVVDGRNSNYTSANFKQLGKNDPRVASTDAAAKVTVRAVSDVSTTADVNGFNFNQDYDASDNPISVRVESGSAANFLQVSSNLTLQDGIVEIASTGDLEIANDLAVDRTISETIGSSGNNNVRGDARINGGSLTYGGNGVDATYKFASGGTFDSKEVSATGELASSVDQLEIVSDVSDARLLVSQDLTASTFYLDNSAGSGNGTNDANATFTGDFTVGAEASSVGNADGGDIDVRGSSDLTVVGPSTLTTTGDDVGINVASSATFNDDIDDANGESPGNLTIGSLNSGTQSFNISAATANASDVATLTFSSNDPTDDFEVGDRITVNGTSSYDGTFEVTSVSSGPDQVKYDLGSDPGDESGAPLGNVEVSRPLLGDGDGGEGTVTLGDLTVRLDNDLATNNAADGTLNPAIRSRVDLDVQGSVKTNLNGAPSDDDDIVVDLEAGGTTYSIGGGNFGSIGIASSTNQAVSSDLDGKITFTGDAVATYTSTRTGFTDLDLFFNDGSDDRYGEIEVGSGAELEVLNNDPNNNVLNVDLAQNGGITGAGTLRLGGTSNPSGSDVHVFSLNASGSNDGTITADLTPDVRTTLDGGGSDDYDLGALTLNAPLTLANTSSVNEATGSVTVPSGGELQTGATKFDINEGGLEISGGNAIIGGALDVGLNVSIEGSSTFSASNAISIGTNLTVSGDANVSIGGANLAFAVDGANSTIDLGQPVTVNELDIDKLAAQTVITGSPLAVNGNGVDVANPGESPSVALKLESDLRVQGGNSFDLNTQTQAGNTSNATGGDGAIVFTNGGTLESTGENDPTIGNVTVGLDSQTGGSAVAVDDAFDFSDDIVLANGDLQINDGESSTVIDLSPEVDTARVEVQTDVAGGSITTPNNDTFNGDEVKYNLAYTGDGSATVGTEAVADTTLQDFEVLESATATLGKGIEPSGSVVVESGAELANASGGGGILNLSEADQSTLAGQVGVTVRGRGERVVDGGDDGVFEGSVTAGDSTSVATITADEVTGDIVASDSGQVIFDGTVSVGGALDANTEGTIDLAGGDVTVEGDVTLTQDPDEEEGRTSLSLGDNDLIIENSNFNGGDGVEYSAGSGAIIFDTDGNVTSNGETISNVTVAEGSTPKLQDGAGNADTLAFDGEATLNGSFGGSGTLLATGSTLTVDATSEDQDDGSPDAVDVPKFVMNSDAETEVIDGSTVDTDQSFLNVTDSLRFESGDFVHSTDVRASNVFEFAPESEGAVSVTAEAGQLELNGADALLQADLPVPALAAVGGPGNGSDLVANEAGDASDILVGRSLELGSALSTTANNTGSLVLTGGNDVELTRLNTYPAGDVLDEAPSFEGSETTYDLVYAGDAGDPSTSGTEVTVTSGFEAVGESSRIDSLTIDFSDGETRLNLESNADRFEGAVTANTAIQVLSGDLDYGTAETRRDLAIADGGEVLRAVDSDGNSGNLVGDNSEGTQAIPVEGDNYTVAYRSTNTSNALTPSVEEFPEGRSLALRVQAGVQGDGSPNQGDFTFDLGSRSVDSVDVTAVGSGSEARVARALDVGGNADVSGGGTVGAEGSGGNLGAQDSLSVGGAATISGSATLNGADIAGSLTSEGGTANNVDVAGDITIEAGGSLGSAVRLDGEGVQGLTLGDDVDQADVSSLTVDQSATADTETPRVELSGGDLNMESGGNGLTLNGGLIVAQNDELIDLNDAGFDRNVEDGETSHVVGSVRQTIGEDGSDGQVRANFPVGTEAGSFRSYELIFPNGLAETELTVDHVTTDPGTEGLPVEDETGVTVQSTPGYRWEVTSDQNVGLGQSYEVSLQADSLDFSEVPADNFRLVRRGNVEGSAFSLIGTGENYSNFRTQQDGEAQIRTSSATEDITTAGVIFTVGQPTAETAEGLQIAGQVNYPTVSDGNVVDGRALEGVEVEATSADTSATDTTDADGNFTIGGLDSGDYEVTANVDRDVSNVSIGDAQRTVSGFVGTEPFAGTFQEEVADVNASGIDEPEVNATDALRIAFFDIGAITSFEAGSFLVDTTEVELGSESESGVTIRVAEFGDADLSGGSSDSGGDASLATTTVSPKSSAQTAAKSATESASDANRVAAGETFEVPVRVDRGAEVGSYSLSLEYDTEKATFEGISSGQDDIITNGSKEDGTLQVGWFDRSGKSTLELTGGSELVTLRFSAAEGVEGAEFAPEITSGEINGPGAKAVAAGVETQAVRIAKPAPDEFALNGSYPNPASQQATVEMDLPVRAQVTVEVYNTLGQRVQTVEQSMSAGAGQTVQLDASQLASGQYFYRVKASLDGNQTRETGRLTIVK